MIDVHCHLNFEAFEKDYDQVIKDATEAGVAIIINVGTKLDSSQKAVELAQAYPNLYAIVGVHPHHADKVNNTVIRARDENTRPGSDSGQARMTNDDWLKQLEQIALSSKKVVGIGEIGMDYYRYQSNGIVDKTVQKEIFIKQIKLSYSLKLPLQIHNRQAGEDVIAILKENKEYLLPTPGMFHCFAGTKEVLKDALEMGFYIGLDGNITYKGIAPGETVSLPELVACTPLDRIVVETDSPYLTPIPYRGSRNQPKYAIITAGKIAEIKNVSKEQVKEQTTKNAKALFHIDI